MKKDLLAMMMDYRVAVFLSAVSLGKIDIEKIQEVEAFVNLKDCRTGQMDYGIFMRTSIETPLIQSSFVFVVVGGTMQDFQLRELTHYNVRVAPSTLSSRSQMLVKTEDWDFEVYVLNQFLGKLMEGREVQAESDKINERNKRNPRVQGVLR